MRILIVDDIEQNRYMLKVLLEGHGHQVLSASNGAEALKIAWSNPPDIIVTDILMPVMDGFTLCRKWKQDERLMEIPLVFYTATYTDPKDEDLALSLGAERFIVKPVEPAAFLEILNDVLEAHREDRLTASREPVDGEEVLYREYNEALIRKLEQKMFELEDEIARRKQTEKALRESESQYRKLFDFGSDALAVIEMETGAVLDINKTFLERYGYSKKEIQGMKFSDFSANPAMTEQAIPTHSTDNPIVRHKRKDGTVFPAEMTASIFEHREKEVVIAAIRDVTERRRLENQLREAQKMEALGTLVGGIAHEFNNVLGIIMGNTELTLKELHKRNPAYSNIQEIQKASHRAKDVVKQLLSYIRKVEYETKPVKLIPVLQDAIKLIRSALPKSIDIHQHIAAVEDTIIADPTHIHQILLNLCTNASHAMEVTGGVLKIDMQNAILDEDSASFLKPSLAPGKYVRITVTDTGPGIDPGIIDLIFDPFFTTKEPGKGTGMGLSVVQGIVKSYQGAISVGSTPGEGTVFSIFFPVTEEKTVTAPDKIEEELPTGNERILFIDDEKAIAGIAEQILGRLGYRVDIQLDPVEALALFRSAPNRFDLVITDMAMPHLDGKQVAREILNIRSGTPIILCTGFSDQLPERGTKDLGIKAVAMKPLMIKDFATLVRTTLDGK